MHTNTKTDTANAVTWGIFPGQEIVQPTVVEQGAFIAWKDEAFKLWQLWAHLYPSDSVTCNLLEKVRSTWYLVNLVDNNFKSQFALYDLLDQVNLEVSYEAGK